MTNINQTRRNKMKVPSAIFAFIMVQFAFYLFGSFVASSFDLSHWNADGRFVAVMCGLVFGTPLAGIAYQEAK